MAEMDLTRAEAERACLPPVCARCGAPAVSLRRRESLGGGMNVPCCPRHRIDRVFWFYIIWWLGLFVVEFALCAGFLWVTPPGPQHFTQHALVYALAAFGVLVSGFVGLLLMPFRQLTFSPLPNCGVRVSGVSPEFVAALEQHRQSPERDVPLTFPDSIPHYEVRLGATEPLPAVCLCCGAAATAWPDQAFVVDEGDAAYQQTRSPVAFVVLLAVHLVTLKRLRLRTPLCATHRYYWVVRGLLLASLFGTTAVATLSLSAVVVFGEQPAVRWGGLLVGLVAIGWFIGVLRHLYSALRPAGVSQQMIGLRNVCLPFVEALDRQRQEPLEAQTVYSRAVPELGNLSGGSPQQTTVSDVGGWMVIAGGCLVTVFLLCFLGRVGFWLRTFFPEVFQGAVAAAVVMLVYGIGLLGVVLIVVGKRWQWSERMAAVRLTKVHIPDAIPDVPGKQGPSNNWQFTCETPFRRETAASSSSAATQADEPLDVAPATPQPAEPVSPFAGIAGQPVVASLSPRPSPGSVRPSIVPAWVWLLIGGAAVALVLMVCGGVAWLFFSHGSVAQPSRNVTIPATIRITADDEFELYVNGVFVGNGNDWHQCYRFDVSLQPGANVVAVKCVDTGFEAGMLFDMQAGSSRVVSGPAWKTSVREVLGWNQLSFDDRDWKAPTDHGPYGEGAWGRNTPFPTDTQARWIWGEPPPRPVAYFRRIVQLEEAAQRP